MPRIESMRDAAWRPLPAFAPRLPHLLLWAALVLATTVAPASSIGRVEDAVRAQRYAEALEQVARIADVSRTDPQVQYLKGVALHGTGQYAAAADIFRSLVRRYPEAPEPANNWAVALAALGQTQDAARVLDEVLHAHPDYAPALRNKADLHAGLALQARDATPMTPRPTAAPARPRTAPRAVQSAPSARAPATSTPIVLPSTPALAEADRSDLQQSLRDWRAAWSGGQVEAYLAFYAADFTPRADLTPAQWRAQRQERVPLARGAQIQLSDAQVSARDRDTVDIEFRQQYQSPRYADDVRKRLRWVRTAQGWKIAREQVRS